MMMMMMNLLLFMFLGVVAVVTTTATTVSTDPQQQQVITVPITRRSSQGSDDDVIKTRHSRFLRSNHRALATTTTKKVALYNEQDLAFLINVTLPNKKWYLLQFDTGSADTWFRGADCIANDDASCPPNARSVSTDPLSAGLVDLNLSYFDIYGTGYAVGEVYKTAVTIGGVSATIAVGVTSIESDDQGMDGILGMGYESLGVISSQVTPVTKVAGNWFDAASTFATREFGVYLSNTENGFTGEVTFGGYDTSRYSGTITWFPLVKLLPTGPSSVYGYFAISIAKWTWSVSANTNLPGGGRKLVYNSQ